MRSDVEKLHEIYPPPSGVKVDNLALLGWPKKPRDLAARYEALLSLVDFAQFSPERPLKLLDVGCGVGLLLDYLVENELLDRVDYVGVDLVEHILAEAQRRWPQHDFLLRDVRDEPFDEHVFDVCILCGIFTVKHGNTYAQTRDLAESTIEALWPSVRHGIAFNSISKHVDWERDDLFHWPLDEIMAFCKRSVSRHVAFRSDYGPWEVATLVRREPVPLATRPAPAW